MSKKKSPDLVEPKTETPKEKQPKVKPTPSY